MAILRVRTAFTGMTAGPAVSNLYFEGTGIANAVAANTAVGAFWGSLGSIIINYGAMTTENVVTELALDGSLLAQHPVTPIVHTGTLTDDALPPATQGLLRLGTGYIVGRRQLIGRIFIPGACEVSNTTGGIVAAGYITTANAAAATLISATIPWVVWSKRHTTSVAVSAASTSTKWATLRSRRD